MILSGSLRLWSSTRTPYYYFVRKECSCYLLHCFSSATPRVPLLPRYLPRLVGLLAGPDMAGEGKGMAGKTERMGKPSSDGRNARTSSR